MSAGPKRARRPVAPRGATRGPAVIPYITEDDGLPCLELLLSDAFDPLALEYRQADPGITCHADDNNDADPVDTRRHRNTAPAPTSKRKRRAGSTLGRKHPRSDLGHRVDATVTDRCLALVADFVAVKDENTIDAHRGGQLVARPLPRRDVAHMPPSYPPRAPTAARTYGREVAASALRVLCRAVGVNVADGGPFRQAVDALLSIPPALAKGRRPHDTAPMARVGWVALMGNHDPTAAAASIPTLWAGRTPSLAAAGLGVVAPTPGPEDVTPTERALRVLTAEAHMPWFAARVRAVVDETLSGGGQLSWRSLFDVLPMDVFLVASLDDVGAVGPYDIYVVPRVDLLLLQHQQQQQREATTLLWSF